MAPSRVSSARASSNPLRGRARYRRGRHADGRSDGIPSRATPRMRHCSLRRRGDDVDGDPTNRRLVLGDAFDEPLDDVALARDVLPRHFDVLRALVRRHVAKRPPMRVRISSLAFIAVPATTRGRSAGKCRKLARARPSARGRAAARCAIRRRTAAERATEPLRKMRSVRGPRRARARALIASRSRSARLRPLADDPAAEVNEHSRDVDLDGADLGTGAAETRGERQRTGLGGPRSCGVKIAPIGPG